MATFPAYNIDPQTRIEADPGRSVVVAEGGLVRGRNAFAQNVYRIYVVWGWLQPSEHDALKTFYDTNSNDWNTISVDGDDYEVLFAEGGYPSAIEHDGDLRMVASELVGYRL